jgi:hypothetical protein
MNLAICPQYCSLSDMQKCPYVWCIPAVYAENLVKITIVVSCLMKCQTEFAFKPKFECTEGLKILEVRTGQATLHTMLNFHSPWPVYKVEATNGLLLWLWKP